MRKETHTTLLRGRENFGVLGYRDKENAHSHPAYTGEKALSFLFITVAEMRSSGNIRNALDSLDKRIGSAWLSEVVRALETVENSADTTALWTSLSMKCKELQRLNLKAQANTVPRKVKKLSMALMMCFLLIYIAVIGQVLMNSLGGIM